MLNIRNLISSKDYAAIANEIKKMKRLWIGKGLDGLLTRRDDEALLIESCV
jgi:GH24 family phage-related lysozyme (muramidase)